MIYKSEMVQRIKINLTEEEIESFNRVYEILEEFNFIIHAKNTTTDIVSKYTGECFTCEELGRTCGILSAFIDDDNTLWTVN